MATIKGASPTSSRAAVAQASLQLVKMFMASGVIQWNGSLPHCEFGRVATPRERMMAKRFFNRSKHRHNPDVEESFLSRLRLTKHKDGSFQPIDRLKDANAKYLAKHAL